MIQLTRGAKFARSLRGIVGMLFLLGMAELLGFAQFGLAQAPDSSDIQIEQWSGVRKRNVEEARAGSKSFHNSRITIVEESPTTNLAMPPQSLPIPAPLPPIADVQQSSFPGELVPQNHAQPVEWQSATPIAPPPPMGVIPPPPPQDSAPPVPVVDLTSTVQVDKPAPVPLSEPAASAPEPATKVNEPAPITVPASAARSESVPAVAGPTSAAPQPPPHTTDSRAANESLVIVLAILIVVVTGGAIAAFFLSNRRQFIVVMPSNTSETKQAVHPAPAANNTPVQRPDTNLLNGPQLNVNLTSNSSETKQAVEPAPAPMAKATPEQPRETKLAAACLPPTPDKLPQITPATSIPKPPLPATVPVTPKISPAPAPFVNACLQPLQLGLGPDQAEVHRKHAQRERVQQAAWRSIMEQGLDV